MLHVAKFAFLVFTLNVCVNSQIMQNPVPKLPPPNADIMTKMFPLGSCRSNTAQSLPYVLIKDTITSGLACFTIKLVPDYKILCTSKNILTSCEFLRRNFRKIVFWYKHVSECGYNIANLNKANTLFPWAIKDLQANVTKYVAKYKFFANNATKSHAVGDVTLFKWTIITNNINTTSIEVNVSRSKLVQRLNDTDVDGYRLCFEYNPQLINIIACMSNQYKTIRYSFYDPYKTICTIGNIQM